MIQEGAFCHGVTVKWYSHKMIFRDVSGELYISGLVNLHAK